MKFDHYIDWACVELARDLALGVPVHERAEFIEDVAAIAWALSDSSIFVRGRWS